MTRLSEDGTELPTPTVMILGGAFLIILSLTLTLGCVWSLLHVQGEYWEFLANETPILIHHPGISFFYLIFPAFVGLFLFGCSALISGVRQSYSDPNRRRLMALAGYLALIGLIGMFIGRYAANSYWEETFRESGYSQCADSFRITQKWDYKVWAKDPGFCNDDEVLSMFVSREHDLDDINQYLEDREAAK